LAGLVVSRRDDKAISDRLVDDCPRRIMAVVYDLLCKQNGDRRCGMMPFRLACPISELTVKFAFFSLCPW
jgi:hypothetical protein